MEPVVQGERSLARDNRTLGKFHLIGLPPAPRGVPQIEVTFDIDANGIVNVQAKDLGTGKEQKITITSSSGLKKEEVDRMMREAESHADDDKKRREEIEARNRADQAVYGAERFIKDSGDKLTAADRQAIETASASLKKAIESGRIAHAFLFCGTRGVGKTSMARIFARALNAVDSLSEQDAVAGAIMRGLRDRISHFARRSIGEITHRINRFLRRSGRNDELHAMRLSCCERSNSARKAMSSTFQSRPMPSYPQASIPSSGPMNSTPRAFSFATLSWVAACSHIFPFIAGARRIGARVASAMAVSG